MIWSVRLHRDQMINAGGDDQQSTHKLKADRTITPKSPYKLRFFEIVKHYRAIRANQTV